MKCADVARRPSFRNSLRSIESHAPHQRQCRRKCTQDGEERKRANTSEDSLKALNVVAGASTEMQHTPASGWGTVVVSLSLDGREKCGVNETSRFRIG